MSATIHIRINGVNDDLIINVTENKTIGEIKDEIVSNGRAFDRSQIRLAYLGQIIDSKHDNCTLFSMDNCSGLLINGKTIYAVIEKWSQEKTNNFLETHKNDKIMETKKEEESEEPEEPETDINIIRKKMNEINEFVQNSAFTDMYKNGLNKLIDQLYDLINDNVPAEDSEHPKLPSHLLRQPTQSEIDKQTYVIQLSVLQDMGFTNEQANIESLKKYNGNVELVIGNYVD